jgi:uncharacterized protein
MSGFYTTAQQRLQDEFRTNALAERVLAAVVSEQISDDQAAFIHGCNMFFLSTIDEAGFPSCSYKGGAPGFVRVTGPRSLLFPDYDGNGMFMSMGNIAAHHKLGLLFVDFETPRRLRVRGEARLLRDGAMLASYPGANLVVQVDVERVWVNCPRYVHRMRPVEQSPYVPRDDGSAMVALWKRIDAMQDVLSDEDRAAAVQAGLITAEEYQSRVDRGDPS